MRILASFREAAGIEGGAELDDAGAAVRGGGEGALQPGVEAEAHPEAHLDRRETGEIVRARIEAVVRVSGREDEGHARGFARDTADDVEEGKDGGRDHGACGWWRVAATAAQAAEAGARSRITRARGRAK